MPHSRSTIRTLVTKASEAMRVAKQIMDNLEMIRNGERAGSEGRRVAEKCFQSGRTIYLQQKAVFDNLTSERKEVGNYKGGKKKKGPSKKILGVAQAYRDLLDTPNTKEGVIKIIADGEKISLQAAARKLDFHLNLLQASKEPTEGLPVFGESQAELAS